MQCDYGGSRGRGGKGKDKGRTFQTICRAILHRVTVDRQHARGATFVKINLSGDL